MTSAIQKYYWSLKVEEWSQFTTYTQIPSHHGYHLTTFTHYFIPSDTTNMDEIGDSTKIMVMDYDLPNQIPSESGWFKIER